MATLDGSPVFGPVCSIIHEPVENATQMNAYPGVTGYQSLLMGGRGRTFRVTGMFVGDGLPDIAAAETTLLSFADGNVHTLVDNYGNEWDNVIFRGQYQPQPPVGLLAGGGRALKFSCILIGLT